MDALYPDELQINQQGHLSDQQKRRLALKMYIWLGIAGFDILFIVAIIFWQIYVRFFLPAYILWCCFLIGASFLCAKNARPFLFDIKRDKVKTVSGQINKKKTMLGARAYAPYYTVQVGYKTFSISSSLYRSLEQDRVYRFYYAPNSGVLMNVEHY